MSRSLSKRIPKIAILGAGFSGVAVAIALRKAGIEAFTIYEKGDGVGGCWRSTTYPGVACDVPSHFYCFSYAPSSTWSRVYAPGHEIRSYLERCATKYGILDHLLPNSEITAIRFSDNKWQISDARNNKYTADIIISALGPLHTPHYPELDGLETFAGVKFHSAHWNHDHNLGGRRIAVIGSGSSAAQIIPEVAKLAEHLTVFSRTPSWIMPRYDRAYSEQEKLRFRRYPLILKLHYWLLYWSWETRYSYIRKNSRRGSYYSEKLLQYMRRAVSDPALLAAVLPDHALGCKRIVISSDYLPALQLPNVSVVTSPVERICETGGITRDGVKHEFDTLVMATGYRAFDISKVIQVIGLDGQELKNVWERRHVTHRTISIPGFPNLLLMLGPNTGLAYSSLTVMIEAQAECIARIVRQIIKAGVVTMTPRSESANLLYEYIQGCINKTVLSGRCSTWYKDTNGTVHSLWPNRTTEYRRLLKRVSLDEFDLT